MRVGLMVTGSLDAISGSQLYDRKLVDHLRQCGDSVEVFSLPPRSYFRGLTDNVVTGWHKQIESAQLDVLLQDEASHPALLHLNRRLRDRAAYPIISIAHRLRSCETDSPIHRWIERRYLASVAGFICTSETTQRAIGAALDRAELARSVVVTPAGDRFDSSITPAVIRRRASEPGPLRLVFVGDVVKRTGLLILLEALLKLPPGLCQLTIVGNTEADALYMRVVYHLFMVTQLAGVTLAGVVSDTELAELFAHSHVVVIPAEYSGFGTTFLEGMGFGLPAIGSTAGGAREIIDDEVNGYLVPPHDPAAVAQCLKALAADRGRLARAGQAAYEKFSARPGWNDSLARVRQALLDWIDHHPVGKI
jgi:glycosyltransferase involved in cell wall biosynthesis